jgi:hypothetical protein
MESQRARQEKSQDVTPNIEEETNVDDIDMAECSGVEDLEGEVDEEDQLSESELVDYGYDAESESEEEENQGEDDGNGGEDDPFIDELDVLDYEDH